jgi:hypothetical protein
MTDEDIPMADEDMRFVSRCIHEAEILLQGVPRTEESQTLLRAANSLLSGNPDGEAIEKAKDALAHHGV